jgi:hypothetical protein
VDRLGPTTDPSAQPDLGQHARTENFKAKYGVAAVSMTTVVVKPWKKILNLPLRVGTVGLLKRIKRLRSVCLHRAAQECVAWLG